MRAYLPFDGDTPGVTPARRLHQGDIAVTNPDMLHQGIPSPHQMGQFFEGLRFKAHRQMHSYRGAFGCTWQICCAGYGGSAVSTVLHQSSSVPATIANPGELASQPIGDTVTTLAESGAPQGEKTAAVGIRRW